MNYKFSQKDVIDYFTKKLEHYEYNMKFSNMDTDTALRISYDTVYAVMSMLQENNPSSNTDLNFSPVYCMLEQANEKLENLIMSRN